MNLQQETVFACTERMLFAAEHEHGRQIFGQINHKGYARFGFFIGYADLAGRQPAPAAQPVYLLHQHRRDFDFAVGRAVPFGAGQYS